MNKEQLEILKGQLQVECAILRELENGIAELEQKRLRFMNAPSTISTVPYDSLDRVVEWAENEIRAEEQLAQWDEDLKNLRQMRKKHWNEVYDLLFEPLNGKLIGKWFTVGDFTIRVWLNDGPRVDFGK